MNLKIILIMAGLSLFMVSLFYMIAYFIISKIRNITFERSKIIKGILVCFLVGTIISIINYPKIPVKFLMIFPAMVFGIQKIRHEKKEHEKEAKEEEEDKDLEDSVDV